MLNGFEKYTIELNEDELKIVEIIVDRFKQKKGVKNVVTNAQIISGLKTKYGFELTEPRIRKIIQYIRWNNLISGLIGSAKGYYCTDNIDEIEQWIETMKQREFAIRESRKSMEQHLENLKNERFATSHQRGEQQIKFDF